MRVTSFMRAAAGAVLALGVMAGGAAAQEFPARTTRIIVPFAAGGATDLIARTLAEELGKKWGQAVIVENRPGASGNVGAEAVARAAPDGYTLMLNSNSHVTNAFLYKKLNYDPIADFAPVSLAATAPNVLAVRANLDVKDLQGLIALAKEKPGEITSGSGGVGLGSHLATALFEDLADIKLLHVPFNGVAPAVAELVGGHVDLSFSVLNVVQPHYDAGKVKILAITTAERSKLAPDLPTAVEQGLEGFVVESWFGLFAPAGTPQAIVDKISADVQEIARNPAIVEQMAKRSIDMVGSSAQDFAAFIKQDGEVWGGIIKKAGITID